MPKTTTFLSRVSSLLPSSQVLRANTTILLQGLMEGLGWHDQHGEILAVEAESQALEQRLKLSLVRYLEKPAEGNKARLVS